MPKTQLRQRNRHSSTNHAAERPPTRNSHPPETQTFRAPAEGNTALARDIVKLQAAVGNQAVQRLFGFGKKKKKKKAAAPDTRTPERKVFDSKTFKKEDWKPSTGGGKFDAEYKPKEGILHIKMRVHFNFQDADLAYKDQAADPKEMKWTSSGKKDWTAKWIDSVMGKWGNIAPFTCDLAGYTDLSSEAAD